MKNHFEILVIGGGNAGLSVASQLLKKNSKLRIGIVEPEVYHYYQPAWTLVGAGEFDIDKTKHEEEHYIPKSATWIKDSVATFEPKKNYVNCSSGEKYTYDVLVVCPGIQLDWSKIKGLKETLGKNQVSSNYTFETAPYTWEIIKNLTSGTAVFTNPSTPIKCGGAPHKIMYLACDYWRKKGVLKNINVIYVSGASVIFGVKEYAETLAKVVAKNNIRPLFGCNTIEIDGKEKTLTYEKKNEKGEIVTEKINFDMCHTVPPQSAPEFIKKSPLADADSPYGYVEINKNTLQHTLFPNIFSLGDCSNAPCSKTGAAIRKQAPVVVENILAFMKERELNGNYTGYSACPIPTQYGKLMLAEFDYTNTPTMTFPFNQAKPRWTMWILKKYILPWLYWNKILTGKA